MTSDVRFTKMHGAGNDVVIMDLRAGLQPTPEFCKLVADRHLGVGCDMVIGITRPMSPLALAAYQLWTPTGEEAAQCGNGARCVAGWLSAAGEVVKDSNFVLESPSGLHRVSMDGHGYCSISLGLPNVGDTLQIPASAPQQLLSFRLVEMGNRHACFTCTSLDDIPLNVLGRSLQTSPRLGPDINVGIAQVIDRTAIRLRVYEFGAGETASCGSGACAAVASLIEQGLVDRRVDVHMRGGILRVHWPSGLLEIALGGPMAIVCSGRMSNELSRLVNSADRKLLNAHDGEPSC